MTRHDVGKGQVLEALGIERGNAFLDIIDTVPTFRHVKTLLELGTLNIRSTLVAGALSQFVTQGALSAAEAATLLAIGADPAPAAAPPDPSGFSIGQKVRVLPPFESAFPGTHTVAGFGSGCVYIDAGATFAPHFLEAK